MIDMDLLKYTEDKWGKIYTEMTGTEIGEQLNVTRQTISQTLKRALGKIFIRLKKDNRESDAFAIAVGMAQGFFIGDNDWDAFFRLFPRSIREEIKESGDKRLKRGDKE